MRPGCASCSACSRPSTRSTTPTSKAEVQRIVAATEFVVSRAPHQGASAAAIHRVSRAGSPHWRWASWRRAPWRGSRGCCSAARQAARAPARPAGVAAAGACRARAAGARRRCGRGGVDERAAAARRRVRGPRRGAPPWRGWPAGRRRAPRTSCSSPAAPRDARGRLWVRARLRCCPTGRPVGARARRSAPTRPCARGSSSTAAG